MRYIIGISNVSSQGERCMVISMIVLVILGMCISDSASGVKKRQGQKVQIHGEMKM